MKRVFFVVVLLPTLLFGQKPGFPLLDEAPGAETTVATWSIIARDPATGQIGIAVQSRAFRAGRTVPYAEPGVGLVATQAGAANTNYGKKAMAWLKEGMAPQAIVDRLVKEDSNPGGRQVAVIDNTGRIAVYTGPTCGVWAGHIIGDQFSAQGNILAGPKVVEETFRAYKEGKGDFADRLLTALEAGQAVGGDSRGMQAGAVWVIEPHEDPNGSERYRGVDIRVDDHENPFKELRRILNIVYSGRQSQTSTRLAGEGKMKEAIDAQLKAIELNPRGDQLVYTLAQLYVRSGDKTNGIKSLARALQMNNRWKAQAATNTAFDAIKNDPEFKRLIAP
jgi:uncharacterized Ntn-hydrolase superfamily protein